MVKLLREEGLIDKIKKNQSFRSIFPFILSYFYAMSKGKKNESQENVFDRAIQIIRNGEPYQNLVSKIKRAAGEGVFNITVAASELDQNILAVLQYDSFRITNKTDTVQIAWSADHAKMLIS